MTMDLSQNKFLLSRYLKICQFSQAWTTRPPWSGRGAKNAQHLLAHELIGIGWNKNLKKFTGANWKLGGKTYGFVHFCHMKFMFFSMTFYARCVGSWILGHFQIHEFMSASTGGWGLSGINPTLHIFIHIAQHLTSKTSWNATNTSSHFPYANLDANWNS